MTRFVALLRAVNVGGTGKLPMADLRQMCADCGFENARTYIASGNVVFEWFGDAQSAKAALEGRLAAYADKQVGVVIRDQAEMAEVVRDMPFAEAPGNKAVVVFLDDAPPVDALDQARRVGREEMALGQREIYVHYVDGQGVSKLDIPAARTGTARNMNTVRRLLEMM